MEEIADDTVQTGAKSMISNQLIPSDNLIGHRPRWQDSVQVVKVRHKLHCTCSLCRTGLDCLSFILKIEHEERNVI